MKSISVTFKNKPMPDGTVVTFTMEGIYLICAVFES